VIIQSTKQPPPPHREESSSPFERTELHHQTSLPTPLPPVVPHEEVIKIAADLNKLDNSVHTLYRRCHTLQEEFLQHQESIQSTLQEQQQLQQGLQQRSVSSLPPQSFPVPVTAPMMFNIGTAVPTGSEWSGGSDVGGRDAVEGRALPPDLKGSIQRFQESKMQEIELIALDIKQLQDDINSVKTTSAEILERYHVDLRAALSHAEREERQERETITATVTDRLLNPIPRLEQYAMNDYRFSTLQTEVSELQEKVEQIHYLSLSAISIAQGKQEHLLLSHSSAEERKPSQLSVHQLAFPGEGEKIKREGGRSTAFPPSRPSVSASSMRKKPSSAATGGAGGGQRPNSSIGLSRIQNSADDLMTPPTVSFVDMIEPPLRPPPRHYVTTSHPLTNRSPAQPKTKPQLHQPRQPMPSPLQQHLLLLATGGATGGGDRGELLFDELRIGESHSSVWERDESVNTLSSEVHHLPNALLYGSLTVRDAVKYDQDHHQLQHQDETWYRAFHPSTRHSEGPTVGAEGGSNKQPLLSPQLPLQTHGGGGGGGYVSGLTEYTGNWKRPPPSAIDQKRAESAQQTADDKYL
jgi:hypothetical protein